MSPAEAKDSSAIGSVPPAVPGKAAAKPDPGSSGK
jgi:hypothetical protein